MSIDYLQAEMRANLDARPFESGEFAAGFSVGWRAALEAAHAKAKAKSEPVFWAYTGNGEYCKRIGGVWRGVHFDDDGYEHDDLFDEDEIPHLEAMECDGGWVPCTTEAEARRVAGFTEEQP